MADEPKHFTWPSQFEHDGVTFFNFINPRVVKDQEIVKCREDDVFVASYPKSGTTVMIEMVSLLMNDADVTANLSSPQPARVPMVEMYYKQMTRYGWFYLLLNRILHLLPEFIRRRLFIPWVTPDLLSSFDGLSHIERIPKPRLIKTHLPYKLFPKQALRKNCKIVYIARNPKDVVVSYRHFVKLHPPHFFWIPWDTFYRTFVDGKLCYGDWFNHVLEWWDHKGDSNILFLKYEDLKKNPREVLRDTARFLDIRVTEEMEDVILEHCSFRKMKENKAVNFDQSRSFIRKGVIGDWRNNFTVAQNKEFEKMYQERMKGTDLDFEW
ncbi:sulfotransferase 1B1-like [Ptychodera flava]|uniref:sulfotransferase 1B1-like n=1 Tax=Ptychodera flava TaxID=63121 RepID=UPI003969E2AF